MTARAWPSREEWQANAGYAVRTLCTPAERLQRINPDAVWSTPAEGLKFKALAIDIAKAVRPLLTREIDRLRDSLPDRPAAGRARIAWFVALEGERDEMACALSTFEEMRRDFQRAVRKGNWGTIYREAGRLHDHYQAAIPLGPVLAADIGRMRVISAAAQARHDQAAREVVEAAVAAEIARRATDEAWQAELERRADIDSPRVIRVGRQTSPSKGDRVT
ncbi:hypothetical protein [Streptomyces sp. NPDC059076]|uniref:hypothetical protein n=1 Tax=unclassified Streptomyces TaxID=2593676 RepID=UPI0036A21CBC